MADTKFTPGPWKITGVSMDDGSISVAQEKHRIVIAYTTNAASLGDFVSAAMKGRRDFGAPDTAVTQWANAHLIESAPDLYEALDEAINYVAVMCASIGDHSHAAFLDKCTAALAKARGEPS